MLLLISAVPVLFAARHALVALIGDGTQLTFAVWTLVAVIIGHWLGGPERRNRPVLALRRRRGTQR